MTRLHPVAMAGALAVLAGCSQPADDTPSQDAPAPEASSDNSNEIVATDADAPVWTVTVPVDGVPAEISYVEVDGQAVFGGDMIIGEHDGFQQRKAARRESQALDILGFGAFGARWPSRVVPYRIDASITDSTLRGRIDRAIARWNASGLVSMVPEEQAPATVRRTTHTLVIRDAPGDGFNCSAYVGYRRNPAQQRIHLNPSCSEGNVVHEIGHAFGLHHEHKREDRDAMIRVSASVSRDSNYAVIASEHHTPYDLCSLMHYSNQTTSRPWFELTPAGQQALSACQRTLQDQRAECTVVGQRCQFSAADLQAIRIRFPQF